MKSPAFFLTLFTLLGTSLAMAQDSNNNNPETIIHQYFDGWVKKDWNVVSRLLAQGFTFTSPAPDDHISIEKFKEKCWPQARHIKKFEFPKIEGDENHAFAIVHVVTTDNRVIRNVEYFTFLNGKIKAIEVFFGGTGQGFPTNAK